MIRRMGTARPCRHLLPGPLPPMPPVGAIRPRRQAAGGPDTPRRRQIAKARTIPPEDGAPASLLPAGAAGPGTAPPAVGAGSRRHPVLVVGSGTTRSGVGVGTRVRMARPAGCGARQAPLRGVGAQGIRRPHIPGGGDRVRGTIPGPPGGARLRDAAPGSSRLSWLRRWSPRSSAPASDRLTASGAARTPSSPPPPIRGRRVRGRRAGRPSASRVRDRRVPNPPVLRRPALKRRALSPRPGGTSRQPPPRSRRSANGCLRHWSISTRR